jgi:hypothetical protein
MAETTSAGTALRDGSEEERKQAASVMGAARTERKAETARLNGQRGGRPKGTRNSPEANERIKQGRAAARQRVTSADEGGAE